MFTFWLKNFFKWAPLAFARAWWPILLPWVIIWGFGPTNEVLRDGQLFPGKSALDKSPVKQALAHPNDLSWQMAAEWWVNNRFYDRYEYNYLYDDGDSAAAADKKVNEKFKRERKMRLQRLVRRFPQQQWLKLYWRRTAVLLEGNAKKKRALVHQAQQEFPNNAYFFLAEAFYDSGRSLTDDESFSQANAPKQLLDDAPKLRHVAALLMKASRCRFYDDGTWEVSREATKSWSRGWSINEKLSLLSSSESQPDYDAFCQTLFRQCHTSPAARRAANRGRRYRKPKVGVRGTLGKEYLSLHSQMSVKERLKLGLALARIAKLLTEQNTDLGVYGYDLASSRATIAWQWPLNKHDYRLSPGKSYLLFSHTARAHHQDAIAREAESLFKRLNQLEGMQKLYSDQQAEMESFGLRYFALSSLIGLSRWVCWLPTIGNLLIVALGWCGACWLVSSVFLIRSHYSPLRQKGESKPLIYALAIFGLLSVVWWFCTEQPNPTKSYIKPGFIIASVGTSFSIFLLPFLLAIGAQFLVLKKHRRKVATDLWKTFGKAAPPRRLPIWLEFLGLPVAFALALFCAAISALAYEFSWPVLSIGDDKSFLWFDVHWEEPWAVGYFLWFLVVALLFWFFASRYSRNPKFLRPMRHRALHNWRWSLRASVIALSWAYLLIALSAWPARAQAHRTIDHIWEVGETKFLQEQLK